MKTRRLKRFRVNAGMTQAEVAKAVGVTQPNYQRWESGAAPIPETHVKKLAQIFKATPEAVLGRHTPIEAGLYDDRISEDLNYYGEIAVHFAGGGKPLLLSISDGEFNRLHNVLQGDASFVTVQSLANQTVVIRTKAVSDLYFSSEAYDDFGPEHGTYDYTEIRLPDARDWEIVEALASYEDDIEEEFDSAHVKRVQERIMITGEQYQELVADGRIKLENLESERAKNQRETDRIFAMATDVAYQLSTGQQRRISAVEAKALYNAFYELVEWEGIEPSENMIRWAPEGSGWHRVIFLNKNALDYIMIPTHSFEEGRVESDAELLDSSKE